MRLALNNRFTSKIKSIVVLILLLFSSSLFAEPKPTSTHAKLSPDEKNDIDFRIITDNHPIKNQRLSNLRIDANLHNRELRTQGCHGEIRPLGVTIVANKSLRNLSIHSTDLTGSHAKIPASAVNIRVVKWWYQGGGTIRAKKNKIYTPELLLKDNQLIIVNKSEQSNYIRSSETDGTERYLLCSGPTSGNLKDVRPLDAATLQPINMRTGEFQEFWVNIRIPEDIDPGTYKGALIVTVDSMEAERIPLQMTVHPFLLQPSPLIYSLYYRAKLSPESKVAIGSEYKSKKQYRAEIINMKEHGVTYPTNYQKYDKHLHDALKIRQETNLPTGAFFNLGSRIGNSQDPKKLLELQKNVKKWIELLNQYGYKDIYFYGLDEAKGKRLLSQKMTWQAVHDAGGKNFVATYSKEIDRTIKHLGHLLDAPISPGRMKKSFANKWHEAGSIIFSYGNPQVGEEPPEKYRRNFGLLLYKNQYDGAMDYAYQHGFNHIWNDFDHARYRDHVFAYPTMNGVVDTIAWEGFREATYDVRYAATLQDAIKNAPDKKLAIQAQRWYETLTPERANLDQIREEMSAWILKLLNE